MLNNLQKTLLKFLNLSHFDDGDSDKIEIFYKCALLHFLLLMGAVIQLVFLFISFPKGYYLLSTFESMTFVIIVSIFLYLRKTTDYLLSAIIYAVLLGCFFQYLLLTGDTDNNGHAWSFIYPVGVLFYFGHKKGLGISIIFLFISIINLLTYSVYSSFEEGFKIRFIAVYISLTMIVYVYELTKSKLQKTILKQNTDLKEARLKAEKADKLKSDFLAQMSHEIRTPVNTILNYTSLIRAEFNGNITNELNEFFNSINIASTRLIRTIDLILNLSTVESGAYTPTFEKLSITEDIILNVADEFSQYAKSKNIDLYLLFAPEIEKDFTLVLDRHTITQALSNLVDNAIKYTKRGKVEIALHKDSHKIMIDVIDTGIGISREYLPNLFEKFSQETQGYTRTYEGNGLGLALVKEYCKINGAGIKVESEKGKGTTFTMEFPLS